MSDIAERFTKETAKHTMEIRHDDGLHRQIRFTAPGSLDWFDLITWPYNLVVNGSHGSFHFCASATKDMFRLIHESRMAGTINFTYWAEKVRAGQVKSWSEAKFRRWLTERATKLEPAFPGVTAAIASQILDSDEHSLEYEETARHAVASFRHEGARLSFPEAWEYDFTDYDHHYLWMCHAAAWGVAAYDATKAVASHG
jgi:hypothetical protein